MFKLHHFAKHLIKLAFTASALTCAALSIALPSDREQAVNIEADTAELSQQEGRTVYRGHVKLTQGSLKIVADEIIISVSEGTLNELVATGQQASLSQLISLDKPKITAAADIIHYNIAEDSLLLEGNASITHGESLFEGNRIEYLVRDEQVRADERIRLSIPTTHSASANE